MMVIMVMMVMLVIIVVDAATVDGRRDDKIENTTAISKIQRQHKHNTQAPLQTTTSLYTQTTLGTAKYDTHTLILPSALR